MKTIQLIAILTGSFLMIFSVIIIMDIGYRNSEVEIRNSITAQQKSNEAFYDKLWKIIQQKTQVSDQYKDAFKSIYPQLISGRYGNERGGSLMKFVTESNPSFDISLYKELSISIEAERTGFFREQQKLIDLKREHDNLIDKPISGFFLKGTKKIDIIIVTSERTSNAFENGKENDITIFQKEK